MAGLSEPTTVEIVNSMITNISNIYSVFNSLRIETQDYKNIVNIVPAFYTAENSAFNYISATWSSTVTNIVTKVRPYAFCSNNNINPSLFFPNCSIVGDYAFSQTAILTHISLPVCELIGESAFCGDYSLRVVSIPVCKEVKSSAFYNCGRITNLDMSVCEYIRDGAFKDCGCQVISIPACRSVGEEGFANCGIWDLQLPNCEYIGASGFYLQHYMLNESRIFTLSNVDLPKCVYVGQSAFNFNYSLAAVSIPLCETLGNGAFKDCGNLSSISLPHCSVIGDTAFFGCGTLKNMWVGTASSTTLCALGISALSLTGLSVSGIGHIYVPSSLVWSYKTATNWIAYSNFIEGF